MKIFYTKIFYALIPVVLVFSFPVYIEMRSGEFMSLKKIMHKYADLSQKSIYGPAYSDQTLYYKTEMAKKNNPEVLALGNSKMLTMRAEFFNEGVTFYNAGGTTGDIASFRKFLEVTRITPHVVIMIVEPLHFDPSLSVHAVDIKKYQKVSEVTRVGTVLSRSWVGVYVDYFSHKYSLGGLVKKDNPELEMIGLNAKINGSGTRDDGSYHYGKQYEDTALKQEKINKAINFIIHKKVNESPEISADALNELDGFLAYCQERNIYVLGFIPPTPKAIEDIYKKYPKYEYMFHVYEKTSPIFKKYNFKLYNFFSLAALGASDEEAIDEYHTSEKVMLRVMMGMSGDGGVLSKFVTASRLQKIFRNTKDQNDVFRE